MTVRRLPSAEQPAASQLLFAGKLLDAHVAPWFVDAKTVAPIGTATSRWPSAEAATRTTLNPTRVVFVLQVRPALVLVATCPLLSLATAMVPSADTATLKRSASVVVLGTQSAPELLEE